MSGLHYSLQPQAKRRPPQCKPDNSDGHVVPLADCGHSLVGLYYVDPFAGPVDRCIRFRSAPACFQSFSHIASVVLSLILVPGLVRPSCRFLQSKLSFSSVQVVISSSRIHLFLSHGIQH
jgi:hypothetical protein